MRPPRVSQLPLPILLIPNFESMIRRPRHNPIPIEIEFCNCDQVAMARLEVGEVRAHPGRGTRSSLVIKLYLLTLIHGTVNFDMK